MNATAAALLFEAERYLENEDVDRAAECFRRAKVLEKGGDPSPAVGLARVALILGRLDDAQQILDHVLAHHPKSAEALTYRGVVADAREDPSAALQLLEQAVAADATFAPAHANLGRLLGQLGRWPEAWTAFHTAHALAPSQPALVPLLALAATRAGSIKEAIELLTKHLERSPDHIDAIVTLADVLIEAKMVDHATELLANAVERLPRVAVLHARRSGLALRRGDLELARSAVAKQIALTPTDEEALLYAATLELMRRDLEQAEQLVQRALELAPQSWRAHYQLGLIYDALRLKGPASIAYRMARKHGPRAWQPRNNLATILLEDRTAASAREALALLEEAITLGSNGDVPEAPDPRYNLALAHWQLGLSTASERAAQQVADSAVDSPIVATAKRFLGNFTPTSEK